MYAQSRVGLILLASACSTAGSKSESSEPTQGAPAEATESEPSTANADVPSSVSFSDGSGNQYTVTRADDGRAQLQYDPVTPKNSSSGTYSGGEPADLMLSSEISSELWARVAAMQAISEPHVAGRSKGTGAFVVSGAKGEVRFLVHMGEELGDFSRFMTKLRSPEAR